MCKYNICTFYTIFVCTRIMLAITCIVFGLVCACNIHEAFALKCWSPSDDDHHWPKHVKDSFYY
jgi:hypothetical protein